jgi:hypothetical protein
MYGRDIAEFAELSMKKAECEAVIRQLCDQWAGLRGIFKQPEHQPNFSDFYSWMEQNYPRYLDFRTTTSARYDVEMWFDQEFRQTWRN